MNKEYEQIAQLVEKTNYKYNIEEDTIIYHFSINKYSTEEGYSSSKISQETLLNEMNESIVDLEASDYILFNDGDTMMEIKNPNDDIRVRIKER